MALADQSFAQLKSILKILREMLVAMLPLVFLLEYGHGITRIVGELVGVTSIERLAMTEILSKLVGTRAQQGGVLPILHRFFGYVHGENHGGMFLADRMVETHMKLMLEERRNHRMVVTKTNYLEMEYLI